MDRPLKIVGVPALSVKRMILGTDSASFKKVSILVEVTSITFYYKYPAAIFNNFLVSGSPSRSIEGIGWGG
jgi:hypothetical protein